MTTLELSAESFDETIAKDGIVLIFAKVDTEAEQQLAGAVGISSIPTLMAFRDGILLFNQAGALPAASLDELISAISNVDMAEVRASLPSEA